MSTIRTTITIPKDLHEELRWKAFRKKKTLGQVISEAIRKSESKNIKPQSTPYGMFAGTQISERDIDMVSKNWSRNLDEKD